jgi:hypothetical protein
MGGRGLRGFGGGEGNVRCLVVGHGECELFFKLRI